MYHGAAFGVRNDGFSVPQMAVSQDDEDHHAAFWCFYQWGALLVQRRAEADLPSSSTDHSPAGRQVPGSYSRPRHLLTLSLSLHLDATCGLIHPDPDLYPPSAGMMPMLELYFVTQRATELLQDDMGIIVEESVEGIPLVGAAHFQPPEDGREGCLVTLKLAYNMPGKFAGPRTQFLSSDLTGAKSTVKPYQMFETQQARQNLPETAT